MLIRHLRERGGEREGGEGGRGREREGGREGVVWPCCDMESNKASNTISTLTNKTYWS